MEGEEIPADAHGVDGGGTPLRRHVHVPGAAVGVFPKALALLRLHRGFNELRVDGAFKGAHRLLPDFSVHREEAGDVSEALAALPRPLFGGVRIGEGAPNLHEAENTGGRQKHEHGVYEHRGSVFFKPAFHRVSPLPFGRACRIRWACSRSLLRNRRLKFRKRRSLRRRKREPLRQRGLRRSGFRGGCSSS